MSDLWHRIVDWDWSAIGAAAGVAATLVAATGVVMAGRALKAARESNAIAMRAERGAHLVCRGAQVLLDRQESTTQSLALAHEREEGGLDADADLLVHVLWVNVVVGNVGNGPARHIEALIVDGRGREASRSQAIPAIDERGGGLVTRETRLLLPLSATEAVDDGRLRLRPGVHIECSWLDALGKQQEPVWGFEDLPVTGFVPGQLSQAPFDASKSYT